MAEECRSCHAEIDWAVKYPEEFKPNGDPKTIPVNHDSVDDPKGNLEVWREPGLPTLDGQEQPRLLARYLRKGQEPAEGHHRGVSHFATCPEADRWRRERSAKPAWDQGRDMP